MKNWEYGANSYFKTAFYILEEGPWYSFMIENIMNYIIDHSPDIPIPFGSKIKIKDDFFNEEQIFNIKEYYGYLNDLVFCFIFNPMYQWCFSKRIINSIDVDYETLKKEKYHEAPELFESKEETI